MCTTLITTIILAIAMLVMCGELSWDLCYGLQLSFFCLMTCLLIWMTHFHGNLKTTYYTMHYIGLPSLLNSCASFRCGMNTEYLMSISSKSSTPLSPLLVL